MIKKLCIFAVCLVLIVSVLPAVHGTPPVVIDNADLLTASEEETLRISLEETGEQLQMDVAVLTVDSLDGKSARDYADDYYDANGYGPDGVLLLVSMQEREWHITTCGEAIGRITDREIASVDDSVTSWLSSADYLQAFLAYADSIRLYADTGSNSTADRDDAYYYGEPQYRYRESAGGGKTAVGWIVCFVIGLTAGLISVLIMKAQLVSVRPQNAAAGYVVSGSFGLIHSNELFLFRNVSRVRRNQDGQHHGGRSMGGSHRGSSGRSHGGGGGRF